MNLVLPLADLTVTVQSLESLGHHPASSVLDDSLDLFPSPSAYQTVVSHVESMEPRQRDWSLCQIWLRVLEMSSVQDQIWISQDQPLL